MLLCTAAADSSSEIVERLVHRYLATWIDRYLYVATLDDDGAAVGRRRSIQ